MSDQQSYEANQRAAERAHDHSNDLGKRLVDASARDAQEAIKVVLLINGGAAVAILAFMGSIVSKGGYSIAELKSVSHSLYWFIAGIVGAGVTSGCAYFCNSYYSGSHLNALKDWTHPYVHPTPLSSKYLRAARYLNWVADGFAISSLLTFVIGVYVAASAIVNLSPR